MNKNIVGNKYGHLTVLKCVKSDIDFNKCRFLCLCECGKNIEVSYSALKKNKNISCGCMNKKLGPHTKRLPSSVIGKRFGKLIVLDELEPHVTPNGSKQRIVKVQCDCGNVYEVRLSSAQSTKQCRTCSGKASRKDVTGKRFGRLLVISMADDYISPSGSRLSRCKCVCDCGNEVIINLSQLVTGATRSCGCLHNSSGLLKDVPSLVEKYDFKRNSEIGLNFETLTARTTTKAWWKCSKCGNSWLATIASQNDKIKHGCPYCSGRNVMEGKTDLASQYPDVASEWNYDKNSITPNKVHAKSSVKYWWKCHECGHEWKQTVANRTFNQAGCPKCNLENVNSFCEQAVYYYVKKAFPDAINSDFSLGMELDIYIPSKKIAIEYDGDAWHRSNYKATIDLKKNELCNNHGITMIRIREPRLHSIENCISFIRTDSTTNKSLNEVISKVLYYLGSNITPDVDIDTGKIMEQYATKKYEKSLAYCSPSVAKEWHPEKNGLLTPDKVSNSARRVVWWKCSKGHEWTMPVSARTRKEHFSAKANRTLRAQGCPYCSGKRILIGFNDLTTTHPNIAKEWHPTKNPTLKPTDVSYGSNKVVWWLGMCGHEWESSIASRCRYNSKCPICNRSKNLLH